MNDFQEQAKNWLRNVVKQNPDKIKAGAEKAGDLIDKQTGGKYAGKVDEMQKKVGDFVNSQTSDGTTDPQAEPPSAASDQPTASQQSGTQQPGTQQADEAPQAGGAAEGEGGRPGSQP
jgi:hypothetical protein